MVLLAPLRCWLADRYGMKPVVERAMLGGALVLATMGFVQNAPQLLLLRAVQGSLTGTIAAATRLVASTVPRQRYGCAMGLLQMAFFSSASPDPIFGRVVTDTVGLRHGSRERQWCHDTMSNHGD